METCHCYIFEKLWLRVGRLRAKEPTLISYKEFLTCWCLGNSHIHKYNTPYGLACASYISTLELDNA